MLHFKKTSWQSSFLPSRTRFGFIMRLLWLKMRSTGAEVAGTDNTLSRCCCRVSNDLSAFTAAHGSQSCATSTVSRYLMAAFLTVTGGAETFLNWISVLSVTNKNKGYHCNLSMDSRTECSRPRPDQLEAKAKARQPRGQGQGHRIVLEFKANHRGHHPWSVCPHNKTKMAETTITKLAITSPCPPINIRSKVKVTKCKNTLKAIKWPAWVTYSIKFTPSSCFSILFFFAIYR